MGWATRKNWGQVGGTRAAKAVTYASKHLELPLSVRKKALCRKLIQTLNEGAVKHSFRVLTRVRERLLKSEWCRDPAGMCKHLNLLLNTCTGTVCLFI